MSGPTDMDDQGPDLSQPVTVTGASEPLNLLDAEFQVDHAAQNAMASVMESGVVENVEGLNGVASTMLHNSATLFAAKALFDLTNDEGPIPRILGPKQEGPKR